jgi:RNA-directed DNA polymerase
METKLEQIAVKARREPNLRFTSLAHHITRDRVQKNLLQIPKRSAAGVDGQTVEAARESFDGWIEPMLQSIHRQGYRAPNIRRVYIPKPGIVPRSSQSLPPASPQDSFSALAAIGDKRSGQRRTKRPAFRQA